jgi:hypothetical protein
MRDVARHADAKGCEMKFASTADTATNGVKFLAYGEAGAGKTYAIRTLIPARPVIISAEGGMLSLRDVSIPVVQVSTIDDVREAYRFLATSNEGKAFDWICLDSLSEILEAVLTSEKEKTSDPRQAYGAVIDVGMALVRMFRDLPRNIYFSAKQERKEDEHDRSLFFPSAPGAKLSQKLPYLFDEVFALRVWAEDGALQRRFQTRTDGSYVAKDRSGALEPFEPPDLLAIARKIAGTKNKNNDEA